MNDTLDWPRVQHLLRSGILALLIVLTGDMILGWGVIGNYGLINALDTDWISIGNLWMMCGLLITSMKVSK